jgi:hypothetical protein
MRAFHVEFELIETALSCRDGVSATRNILPRVTLACEPAGQGFVPAQQTAPATAPLRTASLTPGTDIRAAPEADAPLIRSAKRDERLPVLGRFGAYHFVRLESGLEGWAESGAVS